MRIFVKRMKKKLIMLLLVLTLVSVHALTAVSADEVSVNKETEAEASEEKEKKAEAVSGKEGSTKQEERVKNIAGDSPGVSCLFSCSDSAFRS